MPTVGKGCLFLGEVVLQCLCLLLQDFTHFWLQGSFFTRMEPSVHSLLHGAHLIVTLILGGVFGDFGGDEPVAFKFGGAFENVLERERWYRPWCRCRSDPEPKAYSCVTWF